MSVSTPEPHLRQKISLLWVRKPSPTKEMEHFPQLKHSLCHWRSWKQINLAPLRPVKQLEKKSNLFFQQIDGAFYQVHFWELEIKQWVRPHQESNQGMMQPAVACIHSGMTPTGSSFEIQPDTQSILSHNLHKYVELGYAAAAKSLQSCPTLCDPRDGSPPGSPVPGILQARTLEWVAISFSNTLKWKVKVKSPSRARLLATPRTAAYQAPSSMGFSRQEYWSGVPLPSPEVMANGIKTATFLPCHILFTSCSFTCGLQYQSCLKS